MRVLVALVVWAAAAAGAAGLSSAVSHSIKPIPASASGGSGTSVSVGGGSAPTVDPGSVRSSDAISLFHTANFTKALASVRAALGARAAVTNFVLYPGYLSVTAAQGTRDVDIDVQVGGRVIRSTSPSTGDTSGAFPLAAVDAAAPETLMARITRAAHLPAGGLHYLVLMRDPTVPGGKGAPQWLAYPVAGVTADEYFVAPSATGPLEVQTGTGRVPLR